MTEQNDHEVDAMMRAVRDGSPSGAHVDDAALIAYRDQRLAEAEANEVERHLASCRDCRELLEAFREPVPEVLRSFARESLRPRRFRRRAILGASMIAAGILLAVLALPRQNALPEYEARGPFGGVAELRGTGPGSLSFVPTSRFELVLAPKQDVAEPVSLEVYVRAVDGRLVAAPVQAITRGAGGAFRFEIEAAEIFGNQTGPRRVIAVVVLGEHALRTSSEQELRDRAGVLGTFVFDVDYVGRN
jgi:hypothetical protein